MKPFNGIPDFRPKGQREVKDEGLPLKACCICQKVCQPYGIWSDGQTCSRKCETVKEAMPRNTGEKS